MLFGSDDCSAFLILPERLRLHFALHFEGTEVNLALLIGENLLSFLEKRSGIRKHVWMGPEGCQFRLRTSLSKHHAKLRS
jgi:hypothetical protein